MNKSRLYTRAISVTAFTAMFTLCPPAGAQIKPVRLMTYNTALLSMQVEVKVLAGGLIPTSHTITYYNNASRFGGQPYTKRAELMAKYIKQDDPDVVALQEVWGAESKDAFVLHLAMNGPYKYYIRRINGSAPGVGNPFAQSDGASLLDLVARKLGYSGALAEAFLIATLQPLVPWGMIIGVQIDYQDSGTMLFSKKPFVAFEKPGFAADPSVTVEGYNGPAHPNWGSHPKDVAATVYDGARGWDELAAKAVGIVRIQGDSGSIINVAFTHLNAAPDKGPADGSADVRAYQLKQVKALMLRSLTEWELTTQQTFLLGDLNVVGSNKKNDAGGEWSQVFGKSAPTSPYSSNPGVWFACGDADCSATSGQKFDPQGSFMVDPHGFETSVMDTETPIGDGRYEDYIAHNKAKDKNGVVNCMQHLRIGQEMMDNLNPTVDLSDHLPTHADFNAAAPHCTPNVDSSWGPRAAAPSATKPTVTFTGTSGAKITNPGNMQWYRTTQPGTYWVNVPTSHVGYDVYLEDDLSNPIHPYHGETDPRMGKRYVTNQPFYVRVYAVKPDGTPDRTWTGTYTISIHWATGFTPRDSIALPAAIRERYQWVLNPTGDATRWFDFYTNQTINQEFPKNTIVTENGYGSSWEGQSATSSGLYQQTGSNSYSLSSYSPIPLVPPNPPNAFALYPAGSNAPTGFSVEMPNLNGAANSSGGTDPKKYYYTLTLNDPNQLTQNPEQNPYSFLTYLTSLQYVWPIRILAAEPLQSEQELVQFGFDFDNAAVPLTVCQPLGKLQCVTVTMDSPNPVRVPSKPWLNGPFKDLAVPYQWARVFSLAEADYIWAQFGLDAYGYPMGSVQMHREHPDDSLKCHVNTNIILPSTDPKDCSTLTFVGPSNGPYVYVLYFAETHDIPE